MIVYLLQTEKIYTNSQQFHIGRNNGTKFGMYCKRKMVFYYYSFRDLDDPKLKPKTF